MTGALAAPYRFPWRRYLMAELVVAVLALAPLLSALLAGAIANAGNCTLDEGSIHPCIVAGADLGDMLYTMFVLGWLMLVSLPLGLLVVLVLALVALAHYFLRRPWQRQGR